jgi:hypothetical protein
MEVPPEGEVMAQPSLLDQVRQDLTIQHGYMIKVHASPLIVIYGPVLVILWESTLSWLLLMWGHNPWLLYLRRWVGLWLNR